MRKIVLVICSVKIVMTACFQLDEIRTNANSFYSFEGQLCTFSWMLSLLGRCIYNTNTIQIFKIFHIYGRPCNNNNSYCCLIWNLRCHKRNTTYQQCIYLNNQQMFSIITHEFWTFMKLVVQAKFITACTSIATLSNLRTNTCTMSRCGFLVFIARKWQLQIWLMH